MLVVADKAAVPGQGAVVCCTTTWGHQPPAGPLNDLHDDAEHGAVDDYRVLKAWSTRDLEMVPDYKATRFSTALPRPLPRAPADPRHT